MDQTAFETNSGMGSAFYNHNYHEMPERDYSAEMQRKNQGRHGSYSNPASPEYREMPPRDYNYNLQQESAIRSNNGPRDGRPNVTYPPLPKKDYSSEMSPGKRDKYVPTNGSIDGDKLNQLIELINQMPKFNNSPQNGEAQSGIHPHTAMENDSHGGNYLVPQLTFGPPNSDTVLVPNQRKKKFAWPKLRRNACQLCSSRGFGMDMTPRCSCSTYCDMDYYSGGEFSSASSANINADRESATPTSTVVGLNSIAAINGLCASVNALNGALGGLSGSIGSRNFGAGVGGINGYVGVGGFNGVNALAMNGGFGGGMEDTINSFSGGASTGRMIGRGGGYTGYIGGGDAFGGMGVRSSRVEALSSQSNQEIEQSFLINVLRRLFAASYSRYGTSNVGSAYDIRYIEPDMDEYRQRVREAEEDAERRRQELIAKRDAEVAQKRQQAEYEVEQETARRKAKAEQMQKEEVKKKIAEAECTRKRKEQELMQLFCQKLKVLRDLEAKRRAQYEKALMEANQRGAPIRQQIALTQRCIQEMEAYKAQIQAQECERKCHLAMLSRQLESICVPAYHADTGSEKNLLAEFCQKLSVIKCEENEKIIAAENTPMPAYEIPQMPEIQIPEIPEIQPEPVPTPERREYRVPSMIDLPSIPQPICCPPPQPICCPPQPAYCCPIPTVACYQPPPQPISYYCPPPPCCATYSRPITPEPKSSPCGSAARRKQAQGKLPLHLAVQKRRALHHAVRRLEPLQSAQNRHAVWQGNPRKFVLKMSFMNCSLQSRAAAAVRRVAPVLHVVVHRGPQDQATYPHAKLWYAMKNL
ncbi:hypothetical protein TSMEX_005094 [Taenia solium]